MSTRFSLGKSTPEIRAIVPPTFFLSYTHRPELGKHRRLRCFHPPLMSALLSLTLLVARIFAENSHHSFAPNHLTFRTNWLDRRSHFHIQFTLLLKPIGDPTACQIIRR